MDYFYTSPEQIQGDTLSIAGAEFSHLTHVMRKKPGDIIGVVDGSGNSYVVKIREIVRRAAMCVIQSHAVRPGEPVVRLHLGVGILKNSSRFDYLVEKATEIGVETITPLLTQRTIPQHAKTDRWQKLALAAMKQSGRSVLPRVGELATLRDFLAVAPADSLRLMPHPEGKVGLPPGRPAVNQIVACIGPEGGFTEEEVGMAGEAGFRAVSLGPLRLRTETAALVVAARLLVDDGTL